MRWLLVAALLLGGAGCAPTSMSPMVMRMMPGDALRGPQGSIGIRTGPRLATPLAAASSPGPSVPFPGDN
ncbi:MAG TPA: hypothetical protein VK420_01610, partial [Longimicrobium sp.]|nr:hypothetical protein [Longimicrobium sp.]